MNGKEIVMEIGSSDRDEKSLKNKEKLIEKMELKKSEEFEKIDTSANLEIFNDEESSTLFEDKMTSIFIRKNSQSDNSDDLSPEIVKKGLKNGSKKISENTEKRSKKWKKKRAISFVDILLSLFVVGPLVIGQWRGIWSMMDIYSEFFPEWFCFILGIGLHIIFAISRDGLHGYLAEKLRRNHGTIGRIAYDFIRLIYIYIFCVACNAHWRGGWNIFTRYCGADIWLSSFLTLIFATALVVLRSFRNLLAPPFIVVIDQPDRVFRFPTRYNTGLWEAFFSPPNDLDTLDEHKSGESR